MEIFIGYDPREKIAYNVAINSILNHNDSLKVKGVYLRVCQASGLYKRLTIFKRENQHLYDMISNAPMATEFALTRFLIPWLASKGCKWALFMDCDVIARCDLMGLMDVADEQYAVMCVKHNVEHGTGIKMDGCEQTSYDRKNWSSVMLWNLDHPAHKRLTLKDVNSLKGLELHQLCWLKDNEIGELPSEWNHLVGLLTKNENAKVVHFTLGTPNMIGYENCEHSDEWFEHYNEI